MHSMTFQKTPKDFLALIIFVLCMMCFTSACNNNPDVDQCIFLSKENGLPLPSDQIEIFCQNLKTGKTSNRTFFEANKFLMISPTDYENLRQWYKSGCSDE